MSNDKILGQCLSFIVVPSKMNPVGEEGNMFSNLFDKVPAKRAGNDEDIAGAVLYLASRAGVSSQNSTNCKETAD
jgi:hypothetical protein